MAMICRCIGTLQSHVSVIRGLDFSADGQTLISGSRDKVVNVWDWQRKTLKATYPIFETLETVGFINKDADVSSYPERWHQCELFYTGGDNGKCVCPLCFVYTYLTTMQVLYAYGIWRPAIW